jgi:hypothetical protein
MQVTRMRHASAARTKNDRQAKRGDPEIGEPVGPPPRWPAVARVAAAILALAAALTGIALLAVIASHPLFSVWSLIYTPIRHYIVQHSHGLPISGAQILNGWKLTGITIFILACCGSIGARIGWPIFGVISSAAVWAGAAPPTRWTATAITALAWSAASVLAFRRLTSPRRRPAVWSATRLRRDAERRHEEVRRQAELSARNKAYSNLDHYFAERGNQRIDTIAQELGIPKRHVEPLRREYLEPNISVRSNLSPEVQRQIRTDIRSGDYSKREICKKHRCSLQQLHRIGATLVNELPR